MQSLLIKDTTRAQREEIVRRALAACGGSCEGCSGCGNSGGSSRRSLFCVVTYGTGRYDTGLPSSNVT